MATPNIPLLAAIVLSQDATLHTRHASVFEQIRNRVWYRYYNTDGKDLVRTMVPADVGGLGDLTYAVFVLAGVTALTGGAAYWLEQLGNIVLTYPYTRGSGGEPFADGIDRAGF